jgi:phage-related protein
MPKNIKLKKNEITIVDVKKLEKKILDYIDKKMKELFKDQNARAIEKVDYLFSSYYLNSKSKIDHAIKSATKLEKLIEKTNKKIQDIEYTFSQYSIGVQNVYEEFKRTQAMLDIGAHEKEVSMFINELAKLFGKTQEN